MAGGFVSGYPAMVSNESARAAVFRAKSAMSRIYFYANKKPDKQINIRGVIT